MSDIKRYSINGVPAGVDDLIKLLRVASIPVREDDALSKETDYVPANLRFPYAVIRRGDTHIIKLALPGCSKEDIKLSYKDNAFAITAKAELSGLDENDVVEEDQYSYDCTCKIEVPIEIDPASITSKFTEGILTITVKDKPAVADSSNNIPIE